MATPQPTDLKIISVPATNKAGDEEEIITLVDNNKDVKAIVFDKKYLVVNKE